MGAVLVANPAGSATILSNPAHLQQILSLAKADVVNKYSLLGIKKLEISQSNNNGDGVLIRFEEVTIASAKIIQRGNQMCLKVKSEELESGQDGDHDFFTQVFRTARDMLKEQGMDVSLEINGLLQKR